MRRRLIQQKIRAKEVLRSRQQQQPPPRGANRKKSSNKFCFLAIVRDESPVIERCLASIKNIATSLLICDTGSVDDTVVKIENFLETEKIPGEVIHTEWVSYGETKTYLLEQFRNHPVCGDAKYIFWLDADEVYLTDPTNPLSYPGIGYAKKLFNFLESRPEPIFTVNGILANLNYKRRQIARNNQAYEWRLPYQEYFYGPKDNSEFHLNDLWNYARTEGNSSRDPQIAVKRVAMGNKWLKKYRADRGPKSPLDQSDYSRMIFYMAEAYSWLKGTSDSEGVSYLEKSLAAYRERLTLDLGNYSEKYISCLRMAELLDFKERPHIFLQAIMLLPHRLEAYYQLFLIYYENQNYSLASEIIKLAPQDRTLGNNELFLNTAVYRYYFDLNAAICLHRNQENALAYNIALKQSKQGDLSKEQLDRIKTNMTYYRRDFEGEVPEDTIKEIPRDQAIVQLTRLVRENPPSEKENPSPREVVKFNDVMQLSLMLFDDYYADPKSGNFPDQISPQLLKYLGENSVKLLKCLMVQGNFPTFSPGATHAAIICLDEISVEEEFPLPFRKFNRCIIVNSINYPGPREISGQYQVMFIAIS